LAAEEVVGDVAEVRAHGVVGLLRVDSIRQDLIIPTGKRKGQNPSLASLYRALAAHEQAQRHPDAVAAANAEYAILTAKEPE
jgi:hypothetical protein